MIGLLCLLRDHADAVEADLSRYHHLDIRDRDAFDADGRRKLTLRMIFVRLKYLPPESAVMTAQRGGLPHWSTADQILAHVWQAAAHSKEPHPMLADALKNQPRRTDPQRELRIREARKRAARRRALIESGEIT